MALPPSPLQTDSQPSNIQSAPPKKRRSALPGTVIVRLGRWVWSTMWHIMMSQLAPRDADGAYRRPESEFRHWVVPAAASATERVDANTERVEAEPIAAAKPYEAAAHRYHLYVGMGCPWAHRTLVVRSLKGLEQAIPVTVVHPSVDEGGWVFEPEEQGCRTLKAFYQRHQPGYGGRATVPMLWDSHTQTIVNNESADIIVMFNHGFNAIAQNPDLDLYPPSLKATVDQWNETVYHAINNGVYRCGFAQSQTAYNQACDALFATLDTIDATLAQQRYLCGATLTLADVRLFTTLFRFDSVYYSLFKCNRRRIQDYPHLKPYLQDLYQFPGVAATCDLDAVKRDYYGNLFPLNPGQIIPRGPDMGYLHDPHHREELGCGLA